MIRKLIVLFIVFSFVLAACNSTAYNQEEPSDKTTLTEQTTTTLSIEDINREEPADIDRSNLFIKSKDDRIPIGVEVFYENSIPKHERDVVVFALGLADRMFKDGGEVFEVTIYAAENESALLKFLVEDLGLDYSRAIKTVKKTKGVAYYEKGVIVLNLELINSVHGRTLSERDAALTYITLHESAHFFQDALSDGVTSKAPVSRVFIEGSANEFAERSILRYLCVSSGRLSSTNFPYTLRSCNETTVQDTLHKLALMSLEDNRKVPMFFDYLKVTYGSDAIERIFRLLGTYFDGQNELTSEGYEQARLQLQDAFQESQDIKNKISEISEMIGSIGVIDSKTAYEIDNLEARKKLLEERLVLLSDEITLLGNTMNKPWAQTLEEFSGMTVEELQSKIDAYILEFLLKTKK